MGTKTIHQMLAAAFKAITVPDLGSSRLNPEQAARFLQVVQERTVALSATRRLTMTADRRNIDRTGFSGRILKAPQTEGTQFAEADYEQPVFFTNQLVAQKARGAASISDETLEENIERGNFEDTLVDMIAAQAGRDLEELLVAGDTGSGDAFLALIDGWLVEAAQSLSGSGTAPDFDATDVEAMFDAMILAVDPKYLQDRSRWRLYVTFDMENAYRDVLRGRNTGLGDTAQTGAQPLAYKGFRIQELPVLSAGTAWLTHVDNSVHGIRREIEIEPERKADHDRWDFHVRVKADAHYEDENAAVAASGWTG